MAMSSGHPNAPYARKVSLSNYATSRLQNDTAIVRRVTKILDEAQSEIREALSDRETDEAFDVDDILSHISMSIDALPTEDELRTIIGDKEAVLP